jgi:hypothetical protein
VVVVVVVGVVVGSVAKFCLVVGRYSCSVNISCLHSYNSFPFFRFAGCVYCSSHVLTDAHAHSHRLRIEFVLEWIALLESKGFDPAALETSELGSKTLKQVVF